MGYDDCGEPVPASDAKLFPFVAIALSTIENASRRFCASALIPSSPPPEAAAAAASSHRMHLHINL